MAPQPNSSEFTDEVVVVAKEVTAGTWEGLVVLVAVVQGCAQSLGVSGALERPLGMLARDGVEAASSWRARRSRMLGRCLLGWACSWRCGERVWVVGLEFRANGQGGGATEG